MLDDTVQKVFDQTKTDFIHSFPARTLGMEHAEPLAVGPVSIKTREQWVGVVEFSEYAKKNCLDAEDANQDWKEALLLALAKPKGIVTPDEPRMPWLAVQMYGPLKTGRSVMRIKLSGYERSLSTKAARHICKTALDGLSLIPGGDSMIWSGRVSLLVINRQVPHATGCKTRTVTADYQDR